MRKISSFSALIALLIAIVLPARPQDLASIRDALQAKYALTTTTADRTGVVTEGAVLVLKKSNLLTTDATKIAALPNSYKNGRITFNRMAEMMFKDSTRTFVSGEKVWVTGIDLKDNGVVFNLYTDAFNDVRYRATLTFPFAKGTTPAVNDLVSQVAEVFDVQESDDAKGQQAPAATANPQRPAPQVQAEVALPPIAPPPPPPADPKEIKVGQTIDQVAANFGQPQKKAAVGAKQFYYYKDMKVTFVNNKVTDVE